MNTSILAPDFKAYLLTKYSIHQIEAMYVYELIAEAVKFGEAKKYEFLNARIIDYLEHVINNIAEQN